MQDFNACEESIHVDVNDELRQVPLCFKLCDLEGSISQSILYTYVFRMHQLIDTLLYLG